LVETFREKERGLVRGFSDGKRERDERRVNEREYLIFKIKY